MTALKLRKIGNSVGCILPKEDLLRMRLGAGDTVHLTSAPGGYRITPFDPDFETQMSAARRLSNMRRNALRELAK